MRYACLCCGHRTLLAAPGGTYQLCDVCCFEDPYSEQGALAAAQAAYRLAGVVDPGLADLARGPTPEEARPDWFVPLVDAPDVLVAMLLEAFGDQDLAGGVSLEEADLIDDYAMPSRDLHSAPPRGFGESGPWHALMEEALAKLQPMYGGFNFMDARGLRFYLPAYIRWLLTHSSADSFDYAFGPGHSVVFALGNHHRLPALQGLLTRPQNQALACFLAFLAWDPAPLTAAHAVDALHAHWGTFLAPDHLRQFEGVRN